MKGNLLLLKDSLEPKNTTFIKTWLHYIDKLDDIVNEYNNTFHSTIKMKPFDVKSNTYFDSSREINDKDSKFRIDDIVSISKFKGIFTEGYTSKWPEEVIVIQKVKNTF